MMGFNEKDGAAPTAPAQVCAEIVTPAPASYSHASTDAISGDAGQPRKRKARHARTIRARGPDGTFTVTGQTARALVALVEAGKHGITALEMSSWAYRLGAYVHVLRRDNELLIETVHEPHDGGWHGRYVLRCPVVLVEVGQ